MLTKLEGKSNILIISKLKSYLIMSHAASWSAFTRMYPRLSFSWPQNGRFLEQ